MMCPRTPPHINVAPEPCRKSFSPGADIKRCALPTLPSQILYCIMTQRGKSDRIPAEFRIGGQAMESVIAKLLQDFEQGKMNRRQLIQSLSLAAAAAAAIAPAARAAGKPLEALYVNHISYEVNDYKKVRDFYVDLLGMKVTE